MGMLIEGRWHADDRIIEDGAFRRVPSRFRGAIGNDTIAALGAEPGRYHLIASSSCPWSHRTLLLRELKGLAAAVPLQLAGGTRVEGYPVNGGRSWTVPGSGRSIVHLHELYSLAEPLYSGRATVPLLWDSREGCIVSNESTAICRAFDEAPAGGFDFVLRPLHLRDAIDRLNARLQQSLFDAVYEAGLAQRQAVYDAAVARVFASLDELELRLAARRYLFGNVATESDWFLFACLVRFDAVYFTHFRCSRRRLVDYPHLWAYARDLYAWKGVAAGVDFDAIRAGYYRNDGVHNPFGIVGAAPAADWRTPSGREVLGPAKVALRQGGSRAIDPGCLRPLESAV